MCPKLDSCSFSHISDPICQPTLPTKSSKSIQTLTISLHLYLPSPLWLSHHYFPAGFLQQSPIKFPCFCLIVQDSISLCPLLVTLDYNLPFTCWPALPNFSFLDSTVTFVSLCILYFYNNIQLIAVIFSKLLDNRNSHCNTTKIWYEYGSVGLGMRRLRFCSYVIVNKSLNLNLL